MTLTRKSLIIGLVAAVVLLTGTAAFARVPLRTPSDNGADGNANQWLLFGRSVKTTISHNGKTVTMTSEIVCPGFDVENSRSSFTPSLSGSCDSGAYLYIFQFQSSSTNVNLKFSGLGDYTASAGSANYGAIQCDPNPSDNTVELCTTDPNDPDGLNLPDITFTQVGAHTVNFLVPSFPTFKAGTAEQGRGLTLFILTQQHTPLPFHALTLSIQ